MKKLFLSLMLVFFSALSSSAATFDHDVFFCDIPDFTLAAGEQEALGKAMSRVSPTLGTGPLEILYPYDQTIFPPDIIPPQFAWKDDRPEISRWVLQISFAGNGHHLTVLTSAKTWTPSPEIWETVKTASREKNAVVTVAGIADPHSPVPVGVTGITVKTSKDPVGAPIFFRDVPLPFIYAYHNMDKIKWRLGDVSSASPPRVVLENMSVCGNCHSFSADGGVMGMDVDYANDKGAYVVAPVSEEIVFNRERVVSWTEFRREDNEPTFGLLPRLSPDGRNVVATLKDLSIFLPVDDLCTSQLFFPFKGILVIYNVAAKTYVPLKGADDRSFVHSSASWSPDGKTIVFSRTDMNEKIFDREKVNLTSVLSLAQIDDFLKKGFFFRYDLFTIPFNDGKGGTAVPLPGGGQNGKSNYFPRYTPDGKWIVFTQSNSFMLLQPDSELYIIPATGGTPRRMNCNRVRMNSWHSFSPNGRWMVFSSKANTPYTQLFLTHIDEKGMDAPPVLLANFTDPERAANIPEFVNIPLDGIKKIKEEFIDEHSHLRMAEDFYQNAKLFRKAENEAKKALLKKPDFFPAQAMLGRIYEASGNLEKAKEAFNQTILMAPKNPIPYGHMAVYYENRKEWEKARPYYQIALNLDPKNIMIISQFVQYLAQTGDMKAARETLEKSLENDPKNPILKGQLALFLEQADEKEKALNMLKETALANPESEDILSSLAAMYFRRNDLANAEKTFLELLRFSRKKGKVLLNLGSLYESMKQPEKAENALREAVKLEPKNLETVFALSSFLEKRGTVNEALTLLESAAKKNPTFTETHVRLSKMLIDQNRLNDAEEVLNNALLKASQTARIQCLLGIMHLARNNQAKGEHFLRESVTGDPFDSEAQYRLGTLLYAKGELPEAEKHLASATCQETPQLEAFVELGKLYAAQKKYKEAEDVFLRGLNVSSASRLLKLLGTVFAEQGKFDRAAGWFDQLPGQEPADSNDLFFAAQVLSRSSITVNQAIRFQKTGLETSPKNASETAFLGELFLLAGRPQEALETFERALALEPGNQALTNRVNDIRQYLLVKTLALAASILLVVLLIIFWFWGRAAKPAEEVQPPSPS
jgi:tetratricopeptide (TPR) repeat protein